MGEFVQPWAGGEPLAAGVFAGRTPEELALTTREHYVEIGVDAHFGDPVVQIDRDNKTVSTETGRSFAYDKLVLATGSYPFVPPVPGNDQDPCVVYRTIDDLGNRRDTHHNL